MTCIIFSFILILCGTTSILSVNYDKNEELDWENLFQYKNYYRSSRQSNVWYPGRPNDNFQNMFDRNGHETFRGNSFDRRGPNRIRDINQPMQQGRQGQFNNNVFNNFNPNDYMVLRTTTQRPELTTVAIPGMGTTISPCEQACQTTMQFDPVCGDNGFTYPNLARFKCAIGCGKQVRIVRMGACAAT